MIYILHSCQQICQIGIIFISFCFMLFFFPSLVAETSSMNFNSVPILLFVGTWPEVSRNRRALNRARKLLLPRSVAHLKSILALMLGNNILSSLAQQRDSTSNCGTVQVTVQLQLTSCPQWQ